ncbi:MAG: nucleotidyltransferase domain-containing protein [Methylococcaceae bacterium]|nr:nucleotidyltransferase domain-containing protein [Methylococcaceae bacterium]
MVTYTIDITPKQRKIILDLLKEHLCGAKAWVYGSRIKGQAGPRSDLDIVVFATPDQSMQVSNLREAFEESDLPFRVDLFVWDEVPEQFKKNIEAEHSVLVGNPLEKKMGATNLDCCP